MAKYSISIYYTIHYYTWIFQDVYLLDPFGNDVFHCWRGSQVNQLTKDFGKS